MMDNRQYRRIAVYLLSLSGGAGKNATKYARVLADAGHDVRLICGTGARSSHQVDLPSTVRRVELGATRHHQVPTKLALALRNFNPDTLLVIGLSNMLPTTIAVALLRWRLPIFLRVANSPAALIASYGPIKRMFKRPAFASALRSADRVIALTRAMRTELESEWKVPSGKITLIYNGVPIPETPPIVARRDDPPVLLCVARLVPQKDHATLLRAFALLRADRPCRLRLAGDGEEKGRLVALASELGIAADVEFLGHVDDVAPLYRDATLTVLSSRFEGFPNVLIEALAHGCPVVATDCPTGPREVIDTSVGLLAKASDYEDLAAKLKTALVQEFKPNDLLARAQLFSDAQFRLKICKLFDRCSRMATRYA